LLKVHGESCPSSLLRWRSSAAGYSCWLLAESLCGDLPLPPSPVHSKHPALFIACPFQFPVYCSLFFFSFLWGRGQSVQGSMLAFPRGGCGSTACHLSTHLLVHISQAGLEPAASGSMEALLFSQYNVAWRSPVRAGYLECPSFAYSWWVFFSAKCGSSVSAIVHIYRARE
jgi:hypothetical protein